MFIGVNMVEIEYEKTGYGVTRRVLLKDAQKIYDEHRDADPKMVESLKNIVNTMDKTFNGLSVYQYPRAGYEDIESGIFTAIGMAVSSKAYNVQEELESLRERLYDLMRLDKEFIDYKEKRLVITNLDDDEKINLLVKIYKEYPDILEKAIQKACTKEGIDKWGSFVRRRV